MSIGEDMSLISRHNFYMIKKEATYEGYESLLCLECGRRLDIYLLLMEKVLSQHNRQWSVSYLMQVVVYNYC